jgi:hypothetical protein
MRAFGEYNIILFNELIEFSNVFTRIYYAIYHIPKNKRLSYSEKSVIFH